MMPQDPAILLSVVNTSLRDEYESLGELCAALDVSEAELTERLERAGFRYNQAQNRFM